MSKRTARSIQGGVLLILLGFLILYANIQKDYNFLRWIFRCFPLLFVYIGGLKAWNYFRKPGEEETGAPPKPLTFSAPLLWAGFGVMLLFVTLGRTPHVWTVLGTFWPLLVILAGIGKLVDAAHPRRTVRFFAGEIVFLILLAIFGAGIHQAFQNLRYLPEEVRSLLFQSQRIQAVMQCRAGDARGLMLAHEAGNISFQPSTDGNLTVTFDNVVYTDSTAEARAVAEAVKAATRVRTEGEYLVLEPGRDDRAVVNLVVTVPKGFILRVANDRGDVSASNLENPLALDVESADIYVRSHRGPVTVTGDHRLWGDITLEAVTGDVSLNGIRSADIFLFNITGSCTLSDCYHCDIRGSSGTGDLRIAAERSDLRIKGQNGNVKADLDRCEAVFEGIRGTLSAKNSRHLLKVIRPVGEVTLDSEGGDVIVSGFPESPTARLGIDVRNGDVELRAASLPAERKMYLYAMDGEIESDFPSGVLTASTGSKGPILSNGKPEEATLRCVTQSGDIRLVKQ